MVDTVFVVGAGASREVGLPVGAELKKRIADALDIRYEHGYKRISGDDAIADAYRSLAKDVNPLLAAGRRVSQAMPQAISIDNFLDAHNEDREIETVGKLAIVRAILDAERASKLFVDRARNDRINFEQTEQTWFNKFWQLITENCRASGLADRLQRCALVVFNYDRCIEHFLHHSIRNYYNLDAATATAALGALRIYHPYGSVGRLELEGGGPGVPFGSALSGGSLIKASKRIRTFTEGTDAESSDIDDIRLQVAGASKIVFLGFAYHRLNIDLIIPQPSGKPKIRDISIVGTAYGMSDNDCSVVQDVIQARTGAQTVTLARGKTCSLLFDEYFRTMSMV